jgi:glucokinase
MSATPIHVVAADVGGTNTKLALAACDGNAACSFVARHNYRSGAHATFALAVEAFLREPDVQPFADRVRGACFAVAGPVEEGRARLTNLAWQIDEAELQAKLPIGRVRVINDFAAAGLGIEHLPDSDLVTLQAGTPVKGADRVVVGAGTGLGVCVLDCDDDHYEVHASEGGHADFAPVDELQDALLRFLRKEFMRVSCERVISGPGLPRILTFLAQHTGRAPCAELAQAMVTGNPSRAVTEFAMSDRDPLAAQALHIFVSAYGGFAGNVALLALAHGGVYIAGGIAPKIAAKLRDGTFVAAFNAKGRFGPLMATIPVHVVMNEHLGLIGAVHHAARIAGV